MLLVTRWTSKYNMLARLLVLREFCQNLTDVTRLISHTFWSEIDDVVNCIKHFNESTLVLQNEQLIIGDFFINWMKCKTKIASIHQSLFCVQSKKSVRIEREKSLF